jgi:molybdate/tungstate transport system substrate-binding protein
MLTDTAWEHKYAGEYQWIVSGVIKSRAYDASRVVSDTLIDRRTALAGITGLLTTGTGCVTNDARGEDQASPVSMLAAGSLSSALEHGLRPAVDRTLQIEARGSAAIARLIGAGQKDPDIVSLADIALFDVLQPAWFAEFATNSIVIAYNSDTDAGQRLADAGNERWYRTLLNSEISIGRTDPALDPLGYRTLFVLALATDYYGTETDLRETIPTQNQLYPETQLISQFETGAIDAAFAYRNMAVERDYDYIELPDAINLSDPAYSDTYETVSYTLPSGTAVRGRPISYGTTIRHSSPATTEVFDAHISGQYLSKFGFGVPNDYPKFSGDAPTEIAG